MAYPVGRAIIGQAETSLLRTPARFSAEQVRKLRLPVVIVPAPGPGRYISPIGMTGLYRFGNVAYSVTDAGNISYTYKGLSILQYRSIFTGCLGFLDQAEDMVMPFEPAQPTSPQAGAIAAAQIEDTALVLALDGTADVTLGDGELIVEVYYAIPELR